MSYSVHVFLYVDSNMLLLTLSGTVAFVYCFRMPHVFRYQPLLEHRPNA